MMSSARWFFRKRWEGGNVAEAGIHAGQFTVVWGGGVTSHEAIQKRDAKFTLRTPLSQGYDDKTMIGTS